jgi:hypothetical protein
MILHRFFILPAFWRSQRSKFKTSLIWARFITIWPRIFLLDQHSWASQITIRMASVCLSILLGHFVTILPRVYITSIFMLIEGWTVTRGKISARYDLFLPHKNYTNKMDISHYISGSERSITIWIVPLCGWFFTKTFGICGGSELYTRWRQEQLMTNLTIRAILNFTTGSHVTFDPCSNGR